MRVLAALLAVVPAASFAQAADSAAAAGPLGGMPPVMSLVVQLGLVLAVIYFIVIVPQQKRMKAFKATINALKKGDEVVTGGGIVGRITKLSTDGEMVTVEIAKGVEVNVLKSTVSGLVAAPKPVVVEKKKTDKNDNATVSRSSVANDN